MDKCRHYGTGQLYLDCCNVCFLRINELQYTEILEISHTDLRPVPTRPICRRPTPIVGQFPLADSRGFKIFNMFDRGSQPTITKSVV